MHATDTFKNHTKCHQFHRWLIERQLLSMEDCIENDLVYHKIRFSRDFGMAKQIHWGPNSLHFPVKTPFVQLLPMVWSTTLCLGFREEKRRGWQFLHNC